MLPSRNYNLANDNSNISKTKVKYVKHDHKTTHRSEIKGLNLNITSPSITVQNDALRDLARLAIQAYQGILISHCGNDEYLLKLMHQNEAFTLDLEKASEEGAIAAWRSWSQKLNLPLLIEHEDGSISQPYASFGALTIGKVQNHRRGHFALFQRRPQHFARKRFPPLKAHTS